MSWLESVEARFIAALSSVAAIIVAFWNIRRHLQLYIIRILIIVPVYALLSWLSLTFPGIAIWFNTIRDVYESFVIYCFLVLILNYCGGDAHCVNVISVNPGTIHHPWPFCHCPLIPVGGRFLRWCKQGTLQFVVIKPVMAVLSLIMVGVGKYKSDGYSWFLFVVYNISYTVALYYLLLFYMAVRGMLHGVGAVAKFLAVKIVVFATYWQSLAVAFLPGVTPETSEHWNNFILCIEMLAFATLHIKAFPYTEFQTGVLRTDMLSNVGEVISVRDVVEDTIHNFKPAYQDYVLQRPYVEAPKKTFRAKTYLIGNVKGSGSKSLLAGRARSDTGDGGDAALSTSFGSEAEDRDGDNGDGELPEHNGSADLELMEPAERGSQAEPLPASGPVYSDSAAPAASSASSSASASRSASSSASSAAGAVAAASADSAASALPLPAAAAGTRLDGGSSGAGKSGDFVTVSLDPS